MTFTQTSTRKILSLFLPFYLPSFLFAFSNGLLVPILPLYAMEFKVPYAIIGVVLAGDAIGMLVGDLPAGSLMRRLGQKGSMVLGLLLPGISTALLFLAPDIYTVIALRILSGIGVSLFNVSRHYYLAVMSPPDARGRIIALFGGFYRMGRLLGPIVGGLLGVMFGLRMSFLVFGAVCVLALIIVVYFLPQAEISKQAITNSRTSFGGQYMAMLRKKWRDLATGGMGYLFMQIVRSGPPVLIPLYAANYLNMGVDSIGLLLSFSSTLDMLLFYPAGMMMDRWGRKYAILTSNLFLTLGMVMIPFSQNFITLLMAGMIAGLGSGIGSGCMLTLGSDLTPKEGSSEFVGAWTLIGDVGNTGGPLLIGGFADLMTLPYTSWIIACGGVVAMLIFACLVPETRQPAYKVSLPVPAAPSTGCQD